MTTAALVLGIIGTILGLVNTTLSVVAYWNQMRPVLANTMSIDGNKQGLFLVVRLSNVGCSPVNIDKVSVTWSEPNRLNEIDFSTDLFGHEFNKALLQPHEARDYHLALACPMMDDLETAPPYKYWISVKSPTREIYSIKGKLVLAYLQSFHEGHRQIEAAKKAEAESQLVDNAQTQPDDTTP